jgi:hypothetical protein
MTTLTPVDWNEARNALFDAVPPLLAMLRAAGPAGNTAVGSWNAAEVATHLSQAWEVVPQLAVSARPSIITDIWGLAGATTSLVRAEAERNLGVLANRIEASATQFFTVLAESSPDQLGPWLVEGVSVPLRTFVCHLLNETLVHGYDIAKATKSPWRIEKSHAALALRGFILPVLAALDPRAMVDQKKAAGVHATFDIRLRGGGGQAYFTFDDGALTVSDPTATRVACHLSADPVAMLLVVWARRSQWSAIARGQLMAWGLRPWLGPRLRGLIRNP